MIQLLSGDCREVLKTLPDSSVQCCVTSPPYWGLRDYGVERQIGLESTPDEYVATMVAVFLEVKRVLRDDGTLWLNLGDTYSGSGGCGGAGASAIVGNTKLNIQHRADTRRAGIKPKDLVGIPWRVAFALQADGWYLRSDIIWAKPNPMPESVTDRPTKAHEYLFLLSKSQRYYYDAEAIKEGSDYIHRRSNAPVSRNGTGRNDDEREQADLGQQVVRNKRTVWTVATAPYSEAHFATFPPDLIKPCILAGTSARGCCSKCLSPWVRVVERTAATSKKCPKTDSTYQAQGGIGEKRTGTIGMSGSGRINGETRTVGWEPGCDCKDNKLIPCTVLDPFGGSGTTGMVALELGRKAILIELNPDYVKLADRRTNVTPGLQM